MTAVHLGGVANLPTHREGLGLRLSSNGLDILESDGEIIGRLIWEEIDALDVPHVRRGAAASRLRRRAWWCARRMATRASRSPGSRPTSYATESSR